MRVDAQNCVPASATRIEEELPGTLKGKRKNVSVDLNKKVVVNLHMEVDAFLDHFQTEF